MCLTPTDLAIVAAHVLSAVGVGFWIAERASRSLRSCFLGGNEIPYGLKSVWMRRR